MKTFFVNIRDNSSDEQKLTYALIASVSVAIVLLFVWISMVGSEYTQNKDTVGRIEISESRE